jgi:hypothetical protein
MAGIDNFEGFAKKSNIDYKLSAHAVLICGNVNRDFLAWRKIVVECLRRGNITPS